MGKKVSRRHFARASVTASAAAVALPTMLVGMAPAITETTVAAATGAAVARRRRVAMPPELGYGGMSLNGRDLRLEDTLTPAGQSAPTYPGGWHEGTTIPAEYYVDEKHYLNDEAFLKEHFWWVVDHESRIPKPGDYFVFEFGRGESVIIVRDQAGVVKGYHNVCRHRGSRLCLHGTAFDNVRPSEARPDGKPADPHLSVAQLASSGNTMVFRCPYHAWTYDTDGKLISFPPGMPSGFDVAQHGLHPAYVRTAEGFIFASFARTEPLDFDAWTAVWRAFAREYQMAELKVAARRHYPTKANWKLVVENFRECYHCQPAHSKSYITAHWQGDETMTREQRARILQEFARHGHNEQPDLYQQNQRQDLPMQPAGGMGIRARRPSHLRTGYLTGSLDGKPVAPLLPGRKEWSHASKSGGGLGFSTSALVAYDDYVMVARFTPRDVMRTDAQLLWLVHRDAQEKDVDLERMTALWDRTYREDRWLAENNHHGIRSSRYAFTGGQPYAGGEGGPAGFVKYYMSEMVPRASERPPDAR